MFYTHYKLHALHAKQFVSCTKKHFVTCTYSKTVSSAAHDLKQIVS